ncbi:hypothetical protein ACROYT_G022010 [Oculina patagonica]
MASDLNRSICGLVTEDVIPANDTAAFINDVVAAAINAPFCVFALLSNLVAIVAVVKTPTLHKPCNILLCSLAFCDCLTGAISQPLFIARRLMIHRAHISCDYQLELYVLHRCSYKITTLLSFVNVTVMSFDRHSALSKPLQYRAYASNKDAVKRAVLAGVSTTLFIVATELILSSNLFLAFLVSALGGTFFLLTPIINHVRMFIAVRRYRNQMADAVASHQQQAVILRREKKVAYDMMFVIAALVICSVPSVDQNYECLATRDQNTNLS